MKYILKNNIIIFGNSCSGKTFFYKKLFIKKIDLDYLILKFRLKLNNEFFFRNLENLLINNFYFKNKIIFVGGGGIITLKKEKIIKNFLFLKNVNYLNLVKRFLYDKNRLILNKKNIKIYFVLRKKKYIKIFDFSIKKCLFCNIKNMYENN